MNDLQRFQRNRFWLVVVALVILIIANLATGAVRPPADPPVTNALPTVCLDENSVVMPCPIWGDINNDGEVNAGDLVILHRILKGDFDE